MAIHTIPKSVKLDYCRHPEHGAAEEAEPAAAGGCAGRDGGGADCGPAAGV